ncbi:PIG-L family deacetylase [Actinokineospora sp. NBRC 105648]|uniref:PIG-L deacetylase family protein n=1 Tax=Actinokineospora sp. NBRC 105648 TaxID=3032206 RepID=UPI0024A2530D|nr:PIG-L family deacetylase [Actinokineospora sp. NBRC 105648]GLZ43746.1 acetylglucosaminylphosphatidylinositol deacetylase [Actinokineospora sp. NBRC 105648]
MVTPIEGLGTPEALWRAWPQPTTWPRLDLAAVKHVVVVAPHPDDEVLGIGGLLSLLGQAEVIAVTDGEASHPGSTVYTPTALAALRRDETRAALAALGLKSTVHHLGQPDGRIDETALVEEIVDRLTPDSWCLTTWRGDGHPDHEAVGRAAATACARTGARLLEYPVWTWHWAVPDDPRVPWEQARRIDLPPTTAAAKRSATNEFVSQLHPIGPAPADRPVLPAHVLDRLLRDWEVVLDDPGA